MTMKLVALTFAAMTFVAAPASAQRNCKTGIPCGNSCISRTKTCRIGSPAPAPARPAPVPTQNQTPQKSVAPARAATPPARIGSEDAALVAAVARTKFIDDSLRVATWISAALAAHASHELMERRSFVEEAMRSLAVVDTAFSPQSTPFVGDAAKKIYYRRGCSAAERIKDAERVAFPTNVAARAAGYARSDASGC